MGWIERLRGWRDLIFGQSICFQQKCSGKKDFVEYGVQ